jgi:hypothetical protein
MPLTMRPTGLGSGIDKDRADYTYSLASGKLAYLPCQEPEQLRQAARCLGQDTLWKAVPIPGHDRQKPLPDARGRAWLWWTEWGAQRQLQAWPLHRRGDRHPQVAEASNTCGNGVD